MKIGFFILMPMLFENGLSLNECDRCKCCKGGNNQCQRFGSVTDTCLDGCIDGYYGERCLHACNVNCVTCLNGGSCTKCPPGYYMNYCQKCHHRCLTCSSLTSCDSCTNGFYNGRQYDINTNDLYSDCRHSCQSGCQACFSYNNCTKCVEGKYNNIYSNCTETCNPGCKTCTSYNNCTECKERFTGEICDSCVPGYFGNDCNITCSIGCSNNSCNKNGICRSCKTGFTRDMCDLCVPGKYGTDCNITCPKGCSNTSCDHNGACLSCKSGFKGDKCDLCSPGTYGTDCNFACPAGCSNNACDLNGTCPSCKTGFTGDICEECVPGKYGTDCSFTCPLGCLNKLCDINGACFSCRAGFTGDKCDLCISGTYGKDCNNSCSLGCLNESCDINGTCPSCKSGFNGTMCNKCVTGKYGLDCNITCPLNCENSVCQTNGECNTCRTGFTGNRCDSCRHDKYGSNCDIPCSANCKNNSCNSYGDCNSCISGYSGINCSQLDNAVAQTDGNRVIIGAAACGSAFVVIIIVVIIAVMLLRKRKKSGEPEENDMTEIVNKTDETGVNYCQDIKSGFPDKTQDVDAVYAVSNKVKKHVNKTKSSDDIASSNTVRNPNYEESPTQKDIIDTNKTDHKDPDEIRDVETTFSQKDLGPLDTCNTEDEEEVDLMAITNNHETLAALEVADTYYNVAAMKRRIKLEQLQDFVSKKTNDDFADEFEQLPRGLIKPCADSQRRENLAKNRYKGIYPYDVTRVVLKDCSSDYINASYIDGYNKRNAYIASIGPTFKYMGDMSAFWIMVWQEKVGKIVMLTKLDEGGAPKCDQYWPEKGFSLLYANIQVTSQTENFYADYTVRSFIVQKDSEKRTIYQVHFTAWPDKGTPDDVTSLIDFRQRVNNTETLLKGPILVHCSAGIGRTGTYIGLDSLTEEGEAEGEVDIYAIVRNMREQRVNMVQTAEQYQFLHNALVQTFDSKTVDVSKFAEYMKSLTEDHLAKEFEKLQTAVEQRPDDKMEAVKRNLAMRNKNRIGADIPGDRYRPKLNLGKNPGSSDFINAVYVNSYKTVNRYLVAQTPLPETVVDFLTLLVQEKVSCIVSIEKGAADDETVGRYFSEHKQVKIGTFTIKSQLRTDSGHYTLQTLSITEKGKYGPEEITIPHIQYTHWNDSENIPEDPQNFVQFVKDVELKYGGIEAKGPLLVHCRNGAEKSGIFCVVSILLEKVRIDKKISVVNTMRQIKLRRQKAIPNKDQFVFCHKCVNEYIRSFDSCTNFGKKA